MTKRELVSVIVPIYNSAPFLNVMLNSLAVQTYTDIEVILINDGSTDDSEKICQAMVAQDHRFRYYYQSNGGVSKARNLGLDMATGAYITFVDSDDWVDPEYVQTLLELLKLSKSDVAIVSFAVQNRSFLNAGSVVFTGKQAFLTLFQGEYFQGNVCAKMFRAEQFEDVRFPVDVALGEDMIVTAKVFCQSCTVIFKNIELYHYRWNDNSATKAMFNDRIWTCEKTARILYDIVMQNYSEEQYYAIKTACYWNLVIAQKLSDCNMLNKQYYSHIKKAISGYYLAEAETVMSPRLKYELRIFLMSRKLYIFFRWLFKNKLAIKLRRLL